MPMCVDYGSLLFFAGFLLYKALTTLRRAKLRFDGVEFWSLKAVCKMSNVIILDLITFKLNFKVRVPTSDI
jgi:hypothetical protein